MLGFHAGNELMRSAAHQHCEHYDLEKYGWIEDSMSWIRRDFLPVDLEPELEPAGFDSSIAVPAREAFLRVLNLG